MKPCIALLTDFGLSDPYLGQMKGVLACEAPDARVIDICHRVEPHNVLQGSFFLASSAPHFPKKTLFVAVVDPGVGGQRRVVHLSDGERSYLAPDNGLLSHVLALGGALTAHDLTRTSLGFKSSATFHGRDVFARLAAQLALGAEPGDLGREIHPSSLIHMEWARPLVEDGVVTTQVAHVDRFGNLVLNLREEKYLKILGAWTGIAVLVPGPTRARLVSTYEEIPGGGLGVLAGSQGFLEMAANRGSAAKLLSLSAGDTVVLADPSKRS